MTDGDCTEWLWYRNTDGYGVMRYEGKPGVLAHRAAYCDANNVTLSDIKGQVVRHTCDNPGCVNPEHLLLGTVQDNIDDMVGRGRNAKGFMLPRTVLSDGQVNEIKKEREGGSKLKEIAGRFGVSEAQISRICNNVQRCIPLGQSTSAST